MNGWADKEPAWWLNLQAQPDTTVELADGTRAVRARIAAGAERERLWARFRDYAGGVTISMRSAGVERRKGRWSCSSPGPPQRSPAKATTEPRRPPVSQG